MLLGLTPISEFSNRTTLGPTQSKLAGILSPILFPQIKEGDQIRQKGDQFLEKKAKIEVLLASASITIMSIYVQMVILSNLKKLIINSIKPSYNLSKISKNLVRNIKIEIIRKGMDCLVLHNWHQWWIIYAKNNKIQDVYILLRIKQSDKIIYCQQRWLKLSFLKYFLHFLNNLNHFILVFACFYHC